MLVIQNGEREPFSYHASKFQRHVLAPIPLSLQKNRMEQVCSFYVLVSEISLNDYNK